MSAIAVSTLAIATLSVAGVIIRPWRMPEYLFAAAGALAVVATGLIAWDGALAAALKGTDVYLFLIGMMLLAELARREGLFDVLAALAVRGARGSATRLLAIVYGVGVLVTVFLSNDATAVVLTPAVCAAARQAGVKPLPYLFACAFVANAASFVLPISNPANLVIYGAAMPPLTTWLAHMLVPALVAIAVTFFALIRALRGALAAERPGDAIVPDLRPAGRIVAAGIVMTGVVLAMASASGIALGLPTFACGTLVTILTLAATRRSPLPILRRVSWGVIPLVAGLFILVDTVSDAGLLDPLVAWMRQAAADPPLAATLSGLAVGFGSNLVNNLPMGLLAAGIGHDADAPARVLEALLVGVDLGPNLSVTGSLATILWLVALRREDIHVSARSFLRLGLVVMPPALILSLLVLNAMPQ